MSKILLLDSGSGGLSIWQSLLTSLPDVSTGYIADIGYYPYGIKSTSQVLIRVSCLLDSVVDNIAPDLIIIACNTASTVVLEELRTRFKTPIVGVVPAIKTAATCTQNGNIGLLATPGTVNRDYTRQLIEQFADHCQVTMVGSSDFVDMAESYIQSQPIAPISDQAKWVEEQGYLDDFKSTLSPFLEQKCDYVVLGCTHFPLLRSAFEHYYPEITWVDSGEAIARRAIFLIDQIAKRDSKKAKVTNSVHQAWYTGPGFEKLPNWKQALLSLGFDSVSELSVELE